MTTTTPEQIQELAVSITKDFLTKKASLDDGIAKIAMDMELNPEQIKRVIETCNTVTYLSLQKAAADRTAEFPIAKYDTVLAKMALPGSQSTAVVEGEFKEATAAQVEQVKEAAYVPDQQTIQAWARAEHIRNRHMMEKLAIDGEALVQNIGDLTAVLRKEVYCLEKLAEVTTEDEFVKLAKLLRPIIKDASGAIVLEDIIFKEAELVGYRKLVELYKEAKEIAAEKLHRSGLEKKAVAGALSGKFGHSVGGAIASATIGVATGAKTVAKNIGKAKVVHPLDIAATAVSEPSPKSNIWDNLQGRQKRF